MKSYDFIQIFFFFHFLHFRDKILFIVQLNFFLVKPLTIFAKKVPSSIFDRFFNTPLSYL